MAAYPPPTLDLPIFDDSVFTSANNVPLTITTASQFFLRYPNAQGTEYLQDTYIDGLATFNASALFYDAGGTTTVIQNGADLVFTPSVAGGGIQTSTIQSYPSADSQNLATITYVNAAVAGGGGSGASLTGDQTFSGINAFSTGYINIANLGSAPARPTGYSQFLSIGNLPYFASNSGNSQLVSQTSLATALTSYALLASPTFTGLPLAPTALPSTNTTQIATTAFVQNAVSGASTVLSYTSQAATAITGGYQWIFQIPAQSASSPYATPPWGKTFNYVVYSNPNLTTTSVAVGGTITQFGTFGTINGTGVYQPYINSGDGLAYYGYELSPYINSMGTLPITYLKTTNQNTQLNIFFTTTSTIFGTNTLTLDIYPSP